MNNGTRIMVPQIVAAVSEFQQQTTGHAPASVTVVLSEETVVITLREALSPAEKALAQDPAGAAKIQEFHRQLFASSSASLRQEIQRITGRKIREAAAEVEPTSDAVAHAFTTGTVVQVFLFTRSTPAEV